MKKNPMMKGCSKYAFKDINDFHCTVLCRTSYNGIK